MWDQFGFIELASFRGQLKILNSLRVGWWVMQQRSCAWCNLFTCFLRQCFSAEILLRRPNWVESHRECSNSQTILWLKTKYFIFTLLESSFEPIIPLIATSHPKEKPVIISMYYSWMTTLEKLKFNLSSEWTFTCLFSVHSSTINKAISPLLFGKQLPEMLWRQNLGAL